MRHLVLLCTTCLSLLLPACSDIAPSASFPGVRTQFERAFDTDLLFSGRISAAPSGYQSVLSFLSNDGIAKLEPAQRPTAWMMRAISEWRTGQYASASASAASGLAAKPDAHSREEVLLRLIPALVTDSEILTAWKAAGMSYTTDQYLAAQTTYLQALHAVDAAEAAIDKAITPEATRSYFAYQKWRMLFNWETLIVTLSGGKPASDQASDSLRSHFDGHDLLDVADAVRKTVPPGDTYRKIMDAEMGRRQ